MKATQANREGRKYGKEKDKICVAFIQPATSTTHFAHLLVQNLPCLDPFSMLKVGTNDRSVVRITVAKKDVTELKARMDTAPIFHATGEYHWDYFGTFSIYVGSLSQGLEPLPLFEAMFQHRPRPPLRSSHNQLLNPCRPLPHLYRRVRDAYVWRLGARPGDW